MGGLNSYFLYIKKKWTSYLKKSASCQLNSTTNANALSESLWNTHIYIYYHLWASDKVRENTWSEMKCQKQIEEYNKKACESTTVSNTIVKFWIFSLQLSIKRTRRTLGESKIHRFKESLINYVFISFIRL